MKFYYFFLLLLVVLSAYSESLQPSKSPDSFDPTPVTVHPNSISAQLGVLALVLPQNEVYRITLPQNEVFKIALPQNEVYKTVLPKNGVFKIIAVNCQFFDRVAAMINFVQSLRLKGFKILTSTLIHGGENVGWTIRVLLESLQHVLKMYTWASSENQASIQFRCRLIGLLLKRSLFRKHDFALLVHRFHHDYQNLCSWHMKKKIQIIETILIHLAKTKFLRKNQQDINFLVVEKLSYFHQMNFLHML